MEDFLTHHDRRCYACRIGICEPTSPRCNLRDRRTSARMSELKSKTDLSVLLADPAWLAAHARVYPSGVLILAEDREEFAAHGLGQKPRPYAMQWRVMVRGLAAEKCREAIYRHTGVAS